jgi:hypothetical protein
MATARASQTTSRLEDSLRRLTDEFVRRVAETIQAEVAREFQDRFQGFTQQIAGIQSLSLEKKPYRVCPVPGCGKAGAGPRYGWFCREHAELPDNEKLQYRKGTKGAQKAARTATAATGKKRGVRNSPSVDTDQVKKLKGQGFSLSQIAAQLGISKTSVVRHLRK